MWYSQPKICAPKKKKKKKKKRKREKEREREREREKSRRVRFNGGKGNGSTALFVHLVIFLYIGIQGFLVIRLETMVVVVPQGTTRYTHKLGTALAKSPCCFGL